jgi:phosphoglycolate phosphatase-like HAD superfamily hydrolase
VTHSSIAIVDIDGVLADVRHRLRHLQGRFKDWEAFFAAADGDPSYPEGIALVHELARTHRIVYLSGRPEHCRPGTQRWLESQGAPPGELLLRAEHDRRPARVSKVEAAQGVAEQGEIAVVVDDAEAVLAAMVAAGFRTIPATWSIDSPTLFTAQEVDGRT